MDNIKKDILEPRKPLQCGGIVWNKDKPEDTMYIMDYDQMVEMEIPKPLAKILNLILPDEMEGTDWDDFEFKQDECAHQEIHITEKGQFCSKCLKVWKE